MRIMCSVLCRAVHCRSIFCESLICCVFLFLFCIDRYNFFVSSVSFIATQLTPSNDGEQIKYFDFDSFFIFMFIFFRLFVDLFIAFQQVSSHLWPIKMISKALHLLFFLGEKCCQAR